MGSKSNRVIGDFAKDYESLKPQWISPTLVSDQQINEVIIRSKITFSKYGFKKLRSEIESYICLRYFEEIAPHKGGSGRSNDFFNQHINSLVNIYKKEGGQITLGRLNPSRKNPYGYASSNFITFCEAVNNVLPKKFQKSKAIDSNPNQGLTRAIRRSLSS